MFGNKLEELRKSHNLSQTELGNIIGTHNSNVSNWERGIAKPDVDTIIKLANFFHVSSDYLLGLNQQDAEKIDKLKVALSDAGLIVKEDLTKEELEKALQIIEIIKSENKDEEAKEQ